MYIGIHILHDTALSWHSFIHSFIHSRIYKAALQEIYSEAHPANWH